MKIPDPTLAEQLMMAANNKTIEYRRIVPTRSGKTVYVLIGERHLALHWTNKGAEVECRMTKDGEPVSAWQTWEPTATAHATPQTRIKGIDQPI